MITSQVINICICECVYLVGSGSNSDIGKIPVTSRFAEQDPYVSQGVSMKLFYFRKQQSAQFCAMWRGYRMLQVSLVPACSVSFNFVLV